MRFRRLRRLLGAGGSSGSGKITVGLITKTETNPYFVTMKKGAQAEAAKDGVKLLTAAGAYDGDNAGQVTAVAEHDRRRGEGHPDHAQRPQGDRARPWSAPASRASS